MVLPTPSLCIFTLEVNTKSTIGVRMTEHKCTLLLLVL